MGNRLYTLKDLKFGMRISLIIGMVFGLVSGYFIWQTQIITKLFIGE